MKKRKTKSRGRRDKSRGRREIPERFPVCGYRGCSRRSKDYNQIRCPDHKGKHVQGARALLTRRREAARRGAAKKRRGKKASRVRK